MLDQICAYIHNYFEFDKITRKRLVYPGKYTIEDGGIELPFLLPGQYFRVVGSRLNDGIYQYPASGLNDETFDGEIWEMRVPREVIQLADEISDWMAKYGEIANGPYSSESFGGYSYTKATSRGSGSSGGDITSWQAIFASRLNQYRKLG